MKNYLFASVVSFAVAFVFCLILIPVLRRMKAGQNILVYVKEHKQKGGTPTMGGVAFISAALLVSAFFVKKSDRLVIVTFVIGLSYMIVGLLDDLLKQKHKENLGLKAWQKFIFQMLIAIFAGIFCFRTNLTEVYVPFIEKSINIGWGIIPLCIFVFLATVNAVNLTDGLDGLAAGASVPFFIVLGTLIVLQQNDSSVSVLAFCLASALLAYLIYNVSPASVFMGDTGSLALGGFASCIGMFTGNALYIAIVGICFVFSVISVLIQVIYYKATGGKRVFRMAPIHHHFQEKGYSESKIAYAYFVITLFVGVVCLIAAL